LIAPFYLNFIKVLSPLIWILHWFTKTISKKGEKAEISPEEIEAFIEMSKNAGAFEETEYKQIKNLLSFGDVTVEEAMTPRIKINAIPDSMTVDKAIDKLLTLHHTRIPVYHKTIDDAEKVITLRELINFKQENSGNLPLKELSLNPITKLPSPTPVDVAMNAFKKSHKHIALVMDEYGGVAGLITLEDIIEEIFGDIQDENDIETMPIKKQGRNSRIVQSFVRIDEFLDESGLTREEICINEGEFDGETLSHLITSLLERFPIEGEEISLKVRLLPVDKHSEERLEKTLTMKVLQIVGNTIGDVKISIG
jgi:putative hemolysin